MCHPNWNDFLEWKGAQSIIMNKYEGASLIAHMVKNLPAMWEIWVQPLGWEAPLKKEMATHSSILNWRMPWTEEHGGLQSMGVQRVRHDWANNTFTFHFQQVWIKTVLVKVGYIAMLVQLKCIQNLLVFKLFILYWSIPNQQCCDSFRWTAKGQSPLYMYIHIHIYVSILPQTFLPSRLPRNTEQISLCYTVGPCWLSILNIAVCSCVSQTP